MKKVKFARNSGEVARAGFIFKYFFAGEAFAYVGKACLSASEYGVLTSREALGVVGLITPWNFPIAIPAWKAAPALACGNAVVLKPSELTPACAWALAEIISRSGFTERRFQSSDGRWPSRKNSRRTPRSRWHQFHRIGANWKNHCSTLRTQSQKNIN